MLTNISIFLKAWQAMNLYVIVNWESRMAGWQDDRIQDSRRLHWQLVYWQESIGGCQHQQGASY